MKPVEIPDKPFFKAGEICKIAGIQSYVLRYWETEFPQLASNRQEGGQKVYARGDVETIIHIKKLLYEDGFTISGAKKQLEKEGLPEGKEPPPAPDPPREALEIEPRFAVKQRPVIEEVLSELKALREKLTND